MDEKKGKGFRSRKFLCAVFGALLPVVDKTFGLMLPIEAIMTTVASLMTFVVGESLVDAQRAKSQ